MNKIVSTVLILALALSTGSALASDDMADTTVAVKSEQQSVFKGLLYQVWSKLRSFSPRLISRTTAVCFFILHPRLNCI